MMQELPGKAKARQRVKKPLKVQTFPGEKVFCTLFASGEGRFTAYSYALIWLEAKKRKRCDRLIDK
jgi:hypothetical protein